jgi:hypothetical protein
MGVMHASRARAYSAKPVHSLGATIRIVHGTELLADSTQGEEAMCDQFEAWVASHYATPGLTKT